MARRNFVVETYKGVPIEEYPWMAANAGRWEVSLALIYHRAGVDCPIGGAGSWTYNSIEAARAGIDDHLQRCGLTELPPPRIFRPTAEEVRLSLTPQQLAARIKTVQDAVRLARAIDMPPLQIADGTPLMAWRATSPVAGTMQFVLYGPDGLSTNRVLAVNLPESRRAECLPPGGENDPDTILLMVGA